MNRATKKQMQPIQSRQAKGAKHVGGQGNKAPARALGINLVHSRYQWSSTYFIRNTPSGEGAKLRHEVAERLKDAERRPLAAECSRPEDKSEKVWRCSQASSSVRQVIMRIVEPLVTDQSPQDAQQTVHQRAQRLHLGERVALTLLEALIFARKSLKIGRAHV